MPATTAPTVTVGGDETEESSVGDRDTGGHRGGSKKGLLGLTAKLSREISGKLTLTDSPDFTAPSSPRLAPRATTLDIPGITKSRISPDGRIASRDVGSKLVVVMVGLPARGKSYIVRKLARYLNWLQHETRIFNVGNRRRKARKEDNQDADFFSPNNTPAKLERERFAMDTLRELLDFVLDEGGSIGILDATNSTIKRRRAILDYIKGRSKQLKVLFIESICTDEQLLDANMRLKLSGPDYRDMDPFVALRDFRERIKNYADQYETIGELEESYEGFQYCKMINVGRKVISYRVDGFLAGQAVYFLLNFNLADRQIWITRHGESMDNVAGKLGGDSALTASGIKYAKALTVFIATQKRIFRRRQLEKHFAPTLPREEADMNDTDQPNPEVSNGEHDVIPEEKPFCVWTSLLQRSTATGQFFDDEIFDVKAMRLLDEINTGICEGMTFEDIREKYPQEYHARSRDKLHYRFPGAGSEAYTDVIYRLTGVIMEIERFARSHGV